MCAFSRLLYCCGTQDTLFGKPKVSELFQFKLQVIFSSPQTCTFHWFEYMKCWFTPSSVTVCIMKSMIWSELIKSLSQEPISRLLFEFFLLRMRPSVFRGLDMKAEWKNTYSLKIKTLEFYKFSSSLPVSAGRGRGWYPWEFLVGVLLCSQIPSLFQTKKCGFLYPFSSICN